MTPGTAPAALTGAARSAASPVVLVLDTNVWLDLLVFGDAGAEWLGTALRVGQVRAMIDPFGLAELTRVLDYPLGRFAVAPDERAGILDACHSLACEFTAVPGTCMAPLPRCRDRHDQPFLELAQACGAHYLISKDRDLLMLTRRLRAIAAFEIVTPADARRLLAPEVAPAPTRAGA